jgi:ribulose-5-phosphate 4-epimerase/fuculose-1-phosphate aldolase
MLLPAQYKNEKTCPASLFIRGINLVDQSRQGVEHILPGTELLMSLSNFYSAQLYGQVAYHDFEGITVHDDETPRLLKNIGNKRAVILRNHGLLALGSSIPRAFAVLWLLNRACEIQVASTSMGTVRMISPEIQQACARDSLQFNEKFGVT